MQAAIYRRVSTKAQERDGYSLEAQLDACTDYARSNDLKIVADFADSHTGETENRPGMNACKDMLLSGEGFEVLIVYCMDRLGRDPLVLLTIEKFFADMGVEIRYVIQDYSGEMGEVRKELDRFLATIEGKTRKRRVTAGKIKAAKSGIYVGGIPPFGYEHDKSVRGGLAIIESEADIVRGMFSDVANGQSIRSVRRRLNADGVPSRRGGPWGTSSIARILGNQVYAGTSIYNARKRIGKRLEDRDPTEWIEIAVTPIIGLELFRQVQSVLADNQRLKRLREDRTYLLSGLIVCQDCKRAFVGGTRRAGTHRLANDEVYYRHRASLGHCRNQWVSAPTVESQVWAEVRNFLINPDELKRRLDDLSSGQQKQRDILTEKIGALDRQRTRYETKLNNLLSAFTDPDLRLSKSQYLQQREQTQTMLQTVQDGIDDLRSQLDQIEKPFDLPGLEDMIRELHDDIGDQDVWEIMAGVERGIEVEAAEVFPEFKRQIFERLHVKVLIDSQGRFTLDGDVKSVGTLSTQSRRCGCPQRRFPALA